MADTKEIKKKVQQGKDQEISLIRQQSEALWWGLKFHKNSRNEDMDFTDVPFLVWLYRHINKDPKMVVEKSVQCGLSELFIINSHVEAAAGLTVMYVLPKYELRNRFVNNRIYKLHRRVARYAELIRVDGGRNVHRTSLMHFGKGTLAYVGSNVESEFIEMPVDSAYVDEKDRCNLQNLELLPDRYTASPHKFHREISNPTIEGFGIDERYQKSSRGQWTIKCPHCNEWFVPDFFRHVVQETSPKIYVPRDKDADPDPLSVGEIRLICECGKSVDRLSEGEYVHEFPNREWKGYRISKIFNKFTSLRGLYEKWTEAQNNDTKTQVFYNSDLGLPFTAKGAKITEGDLNACRREYSNVKPEENRDSPRVCGIDVGAMINYVVHDVVTERGVKCLRQIDCGVAPSFEILKTEVLDKWKPRMAVIDAMPEIHKVMELKKDYKFLYSSFFQEGQRKILTDKKTREIRMDRTAILDYVKEYIDKQVFLLPANAEFLEGGVFYSQMMSSTRILEANEENPEKSKFVWAHTAPDHFFLAEAYCLQAWMLMPNVDILDFFRDNSKAGSTVPGIEKMKGLTEEEREELARISKLAPNQFLDGLQDRFAGKK